MLWTSDHYFYRRQCIVSFGIIIFSAVDLLRLGHKQLAGMVTSLLAAPRGPALGATAFSDVTVSLLPELAVDRADDADLGVRVSVFDF